MDEKEIYMEYLNKFVRLAKKMKGKTYFYHGYVNEVIGNKIVLEDKKVGQVVVSFDAIQSIEPVDDGSGTEYMN